jgi:hypothetical protein
MAPRARPIAPPPRTPHLIPSSALLAPLPRTLAIPLLAALTTLEAEEATPAAEEVTPPTALEALAETPEAEPDMDMDMEPVMETDASELEMAEASKLDEAEGALMVVERVPEAEVEPQVCC